MVHSGAVKNNIVNEELLWNDTWLSKFSNTSMSMPQQSPFTCDAIKGHRCVCDKVKPMHHSEVPGTFRTSMTAERVLTCFSCTEADLTPPLPLTLLSI